VIDDANSKRKDYDLTFKSWDESEKEW